MLQKCLLQRFLSTLSLRRATSWCKDGRIDTAISIHALLAESDDNLTQGVFNLFTFLSTLSLRRATSSGGGWFSIIYYFYPRSPCGERREHTNNGANANLHFYPRSPCGERHRCTKRATKDQIFLSTLSLRRATLFLIDEIQLELFLSTLSLRRATWANFSGFYWWVISIHALLAESDLYSLRHSASGRHFYPRSPCGERLPAPLL